MSFSSFDYDFVISYASEDKEYADKLYQILTAGGTKVFYAPEYRAETWGKNLFEYLAEIYSKKGRFCIPLVSVNYVKKHWTLHEWQSAQERALSSADVEYILPIRLDDSQLPGLLSTTAYENVSTTNIEAIAELALKKLDSHKSNIHSEPIFYECNWTTSIFLERLTQALPGKLGLHVVTEGVKIDHILRAVLQEPLSFTVIMDDGKEKAITDAIWWWKHNRHYPISSFRILGEGVFLLNQYELAIVQLRIYRDDTRPDLSFIYVRCKPLLPLRASSDDIAKQISSLGYASEYLGYLRDKNTYVSGQEFEDGYAEINNVVVNIRESSEPRIRILTEYDMFIAPKESRINSRPAERILKDMQVELLKSEVAIESLIKLLEQLPPSPYRLELGCWD